MSLLSNPSDSCLSADMTFGIELEFIVASPKNFFNPEDVIAAISRALVQRWAQYIVWTVLITH
jgi:hypothetical protein